MFSINVDTKSLHQLGIVLISFLKDMVPIKKKNYNKSVKLLYMIYFFK